MVESDIGYVLDSFVQGAKDPVYTQMRDSIYKQRYQPIIKRLITEANVLIACLPNDPDLFAGFVVHDSFDNIPILHWIHVRQMFQRQKIAEAMLAEAIPTFGERLTMVSHLPRS